MLGQAAMRLAVPVYSIATRVSQEMRKAGLVLRAYGAAVVVPWEPLLKHEREAHSHALCGPR